VLPGIALWAFCALTVFLAMVLSYDLRNLWQLIDHTPDPAVEAGRAARAARAEGAKHETAAR
jgi:paraquat-inducible protein A